MEGSFKRIALYLEKRERGVLRRVQRSFAHGSIDSQAHLSARLIYFDRLCPPLPAKILYQPVRVFNRFLAAFDRYISHDTGSQCTFAVRGRDNTQGPADRLSQTRIASMPSGNSRLRDPNNSSRLEVIPAT